MIPVLFLCTVVDRQEVRACDAEMRWGGGVGLLYKVDVRQQAVHEMQEGCLYEEIDSLVSVHR